MPDQPDPQNNVDRLLKHLKEHSLAAQFVRAHRVPHADGPAGSMKAVLKERLEQVREDLDGAKA